MEHDDIQEIRRILIRTAWWARQRERDLVRACKDAIETGDDSRLFIESGSRSWQRGYYVSRLQAAKLIKKQKREVRNG